MDTGIWGPIGLEPIGAGNPVELNIRVTDTAEGSAV